MSDWAKLIILWLGGYVPKDNHYVDSPRKAK